jgi:hypothetical protein
MCSHALFRPILTRSVVAVLRAKSLGSVKKSFHWLAYDSKIPTSFLSPTCRSSGWEASESRSQSIYKVGPDLESNFAYEEEIESLFSRIHTLKIRISHSTAT